MALKELFKRGISALLKKKKENVVDPNPVQRIQNQPIQTKREPTTGTALQTVKKDLAVQKFPTPVRSGALQMGSPQNQNLMFGSALYDRIAQKGPGVFSADDWMKFLTDKREKPVKIFGQNYRETVLNPVKFTYDNTSGYLAGKNVTVPLEELFDSNIAAFSRTGELTGGFLHAAKLADVKVPGSVLADLVRLNPMNRVQPITLSNQLDETVKTRLYNKFKNKFDEVSTKVNDPYVSEILNRYKNNMDGLTSSKPDFPRIMGRYPQFKKQFQELDFAFDDLNRIKKNNKPPKYGDQRDYTFEGGQNYRETVFALNENIPANKKLKVFKHYESPEFGNPILHVRYDTRFTPKGEKVLLIHEIQSDVNQDIGKILRELKEFGYDGGKRYNPFGKDVEVKFLLDARKKLIKNVQDRNVSAIESAQAMRNIKKIDEVLKVKGLDDNLRFTSSILERSGDKPRINLNSYSTNDYREKMRRAGASDEFIENMLLKQDYFPLLDRSAQASHAIKYLSNVAAREKADYIAVVPVNYMQRGMNKSNFKAYTDYYGFPKGTKSQRSKSLAVIPEEMKKQARMFNTSAGPIKFSLSDPAKPYKRVESRDVNVGDQNFKVRYHEEAMKNQDTGLRFLDKDNISLYGEAYGVKVSPLMLQTQKLYKKEGGLVENGS